MKALKVIGGIVAAALVLGAAGFIYLHVAFPKVGEAADLKIQATTENVARGKYLAHHVTVCIDCHSTRNFDYFSGPIVPGTEGKGGMEFAETAGTFYPPNITPAALGNWSDGEIMRAMTAGVSKDGTPLFPFMPYPIYSELTEEDATALVAYLRTLPPIPNEVPRSKLSFPMNLIVRTIPKPYEPKPGPSPSDTLAYGKYLSIVAGCQFCHTPIDDKGQPLPGMDYAGGQEFRFPWGEIMRTANITPEYDTGIGAWDRDYFIGRFKDYADSANAHIDVAKGEGNTIMPWTMYAGMTEADLSAIYRHLRSVKPIRNEVDKHPKQTVQP
jgi:mono/diheme cytochrome c family protein